MRAEPRVEEGVLTGEPFTGRRSWRRQTSCAVSGGFSVIAECFVGRKTFGDSFTFSLRHHRQTLMLRICPNLLFAADRL